MTDSFQTLLKQQRTHHLIEAAQHWGPLIQQGLQHLAQTIWSDGQYRTEAYYRLDHHSTPESYVWWVEHNIPPYNKDWCAVYKVQMSLDEQDKPILLVQSGTTIHPVVPLTVERLETALTLTRDDLPLLISRPMDEVTTHFE